MTVPAHDALAEAKDALERAKAALGDGQLSGKGISAGYYEGVVREINSALAALAALRAGSGDS